VPLLGRLGGRQELELSERPDRQINPGNTQPFTLGALDALKACPSRSLAFGARGAGWLAAEPGALAFWRLMGGGAAR